MAIQNWIKDERYTVPRSRFGQTLLIGRYRSRVSSGTDRKEGEPLNAEHPYEATIIDQNYTTYGRSLINCDYWRHYPVDGVVTGVPLVSPLWTSNDDLKLLGKLKEKYDNHDFNGAVFVGELGRTVDTFADRARQLGRAGLAVKRGNLVEAARILGQSTRGSQSAVKAGQRSIDRVRAKNAARHRDSGIIDFHPDNVREGRTLGSIPSKDRQSISDAHLELQYGLLPVMGDLWNLADAIVALDKPRERRIIARRRVLQDAHSHVIGDGGPIFGYQGYGVTRKQIIAYVYEDIPTWPERLGITNPASVLWELTPWSFVADWFLPVGDYIAARSFARRCKGRFVSTVSNVYRVRSHDSWGPGKHEALDPKSCTKWYFHKPVGLWWYTKIYVKREVLTSLNVPLPTFKSPLNGTGTRLANAAALVVSAFTRR